MNVGFVRPKTSAIRFQLFARPLHPELFDVFASSQVRRDVYQATLQITGGSHVITWQSGRGLLCEVAAPVRHPLPKKRRLLCHRLTGHRNDSVQYTGGIIYQVSFEVEKLAPEVFWLTHEELEADGRRRGLFYQFRSPGRLGVGPISYVTYDARPRTFMVQTYHTFPEEHAIFKSQSLFEVA